MNLETFDPEVGAITGATVILLNGPPRCGKDTAGEYLQSITPRSCVIKFAGALKRSVHADFGLPSHLQEDHFEPCKDAPHPAFFGMTPRQAYIQKSELRQKPFLGEDIYGRVALRRLWRVYQAGTRVFFFTDSGFAHEAVPIMGVVGNENALLLRIHAEQRGCDFKNDSRSYINLDGVKAYDVENNSTLQAFKGLLSRLVPAFICDRAVFSDRLWPAFAYR